MTDFRIENPAVPFTIDIGDAIGSGTSGSVLYVDSSGNLAQHNPGLTYNGSGELTLGDGSTVNGSFLIKSGSRTMFQFDNTDNGTLTIRAASPHGQTLSIQARNPSSGNPGYVSNSGFSISLAGTRLLDFSIDNNGVRMREILLGGGSIIFEAKDSASKAGVFRGVSSQTAALIQLHGVSSTSTAREQVDIDTAWATSTDASRKARGIFRVWDTAAREAIRIEASGSAPMIGFLGAAAVARPSAYTPSNVTTDRSYDANATTLDELADVVGTLIQDLQAYGLLA